MGAKAQLILAFDFGLKRIGIAGGDTLTRSAAPRITVAHHASGPDWPAIEREVSRFGPDLLLVGAPYNDDGSPGSLAAAADAFAKDIATRTGKAVARVDERYSSTAAHSLLREQRASGQRRRRVEKGDIDSAAAAIMLAGWLEQRGNT
ncbi:MAG: Holliday junction resolvase RuvX [Pseudomonadota bacterium]